MKKITYLLMLVCMLSSIKVNAQPIMSYRFESRQGTYEEITGGTVVGAGILGDGLRNIAFDGVVKEGIKTKTTTSGIPIGFNFIFNDIAMNRFVISPHGYLFLGKDQIVVNPTRGSFLLMDMDEGKENLVGAGVNTDLTAIETTEISYKLIGASPNRVLVVQFKEVKLATDWWDGAKVVNLQVRLYETSNKIEVVFKDWLNESSSSKDVRVGIRGDLEDVHVRMSPKDNWMETEIDTDVRGISWSSSCYPADGLTYVFTMPETCPEPSAQPSNLKLEASSIRVKGSFTGTETADHYLVVMSEQPTLSVLPENKKKYKEGDVIGDATVVTYTTDFTFETKENLSGTKDYSFYLFATNSFCAYGPIYNTVTPLTGTIKTLPEKPEKTELKEISYENMTLSVTGNPSNDHVIIALTDEPLLDFGETPTGEGVFGIPKGEVNVGDKLEGGGKIVYKGEANEAIKIEGLTNNTLYHFRVWSVNNDNNYSSTFEEFVGLTWGRLPYKAQFDKMAAYEPPVGWDITGSFTITDQSLSHLGNEKIQLYSNIPAGNPTDGKLNTAATQWIQLGSATNRVFFRYNITTWSRFGGYAPYTNWDERDALEIQVSKDGENYTTIHKIDNTNAVAVPSATDWVTVKVPFTQMAGEKVKVRLSWNTYSPGTIRMYLEDFNVEEKPACDYPVDLYVDQASVVGAKALIGWKPTGEENAWDVRFRKVGSQTWSEPFESRAKTYTLTTLPTSSEVEVQVRAKCSLTSFSPWSKSLIFTSGYMPPFTEKFDSSTLPSGWSFESGILSDSTEFCTGSGMACQKYWLLNNNTLRIVYSYRPKDWVHTPKIDLGDGSYHAKLDFDLKLTKKAGTPTSEDTYFAVVISTDGGTSFRKENVLKEWKGSQVADIGDSTHYSIDLSKYKGVIKIGFYAQGTNSAAGELVWLDNVAFLETCPAATNVNVTEVTPTTATVTWDGESDEWLTFIREAGSIKKDYQKQTKNEWSLSNLTPKTNYEVGVTKACVQNDTARIVLAWFTTQSLAPCLVPSDISVVASQRFVTFSWEGEGMSYNARIREAGTEEWINKTTQTTSVKIDGLEPETEYEYSLQSVCSAAQGDISPWTEVAKVKTLAVTCFAPTDLTVEPTYKYTTVSWNGEADKYQLNLREEGKNWIEYIVNGGETYMLSELNILTKYSVRMRSICAVGDTSVWSATVDFETPDVPPCVIPTNLEASGISDTSATLAWDADESNLSWDLRYREGAVTSWVIEKGLTEKRYELTGLKANTAYLWGVKATCDEERTSLWAAQEAFDTQASGIEGIDGSDVRTFVSNGMINVVNPSGMQIEKIRLFGTDGKVLKEYSINSNENILIPTQMDASTIILKVYGKNSVYTYTLILR